MKKILLILPVFIMLCSCAKSVEINNTSFVKIINNSFDYEIISKENSVSKIDADENITYYFPENSEITITVYSDLKTGVIKKYTLSGYNNDKTFNSFSDSFFTAISQNNQHISISYQACGEMKIIVYEDLRYKYKSENPTLKK